MFKDYAKDILASMINGKLKYMLKDGQSVKVDLNQFNVTDVKRSGNTAKVDVDFISGKFKGDKTTFDIELLTLPHSTIIFPTGVTRDQIWLALYTDYLILLTKEQYEALPERVTKTTVIKIDMDKSYRYAGELSIDFQDKVTEEAKDIADRYSLTTGWWEGPQASFVIDIESCVRLWRGIFDITRSSFDCAWDAACLASIYRGAAMQRPTFTASDRTALLPINEQRARDEGGFGGTHFYVFGDGSKEIVKLGFEGGNNLPWLESWCDALPQHANLLHLAFSPRAIEKLWSDIDVSGETLALGSDVNVDTFRNGANYGVDNSIDASVLAQLTEKVYEFRFAPGDEKYENISYVFESGAKAFDSYRVNESAPFSRSISNIKYNEEGEPIPHIDAFSKLQEWFAKDLYGSRYYKHFEIQNDKIIALESVTLPEYLGSVGNIEMRIIVEVPLTVKSVEIDEEELLRGTTVEEFDIDYALRFLYLDSKDVGLLSLKRLSLERIAAQRLTSRLLHESLHDTYAIKDVSGKTNFEAVKYPEEEKVVYTCKATGFAAVVKGPKLSKN